MWGRPAHRRAAIRASRKSAASAGFALRREAGSVNLGKLRNGRKGTSVPAEAQARVSREARGDEP
jgi:hypothetical protein